MRVKWGENKRKVERVGGGNAAHWCPDAMLFSSNLDFIFLLQLPATYPIFLTINCLLFLTIHVLSKYDAGTV